LLADDTPLLAAGAGAVAFSDHTGIGGSFAHNGVNALTRAYAENTVLVASGIQVQASTADTLLTFSDGGSAAPVGLAVAGSVNLNRTARLTEAALGANVVATATGALSDPALPRAHPGAPAGVLDPAGVVVQADSTLRVVSKAGASAATRQGLLAAGAAADLGDLANAAYAYVGDQATVTAVNDVQILAATHEDVRSVAASMAQGGQGASNRLYRNDGSASPFQGTAGEDAGGRGTRTTSAALGDLDGDGSSTAATSTTAPATSAPAPRWGRFSASLATPSRTWPRPRRTPTPSCPT
jgi:hypothetical protein